MRIEIGPEESEESKKQRKMVADFVKRYPKGPLVRKKPRKRNRDGTWRKKRSDAGKKREKNMSETTNNARDTQFARFALMLMNEILNVKGMYTNPNWRLDCQDVIARRAYDLNQHSVGHTLEYLHECDIKTSGGMGKRIVPSIPDMTELPKEQDQ